MRLAAFHVSLSKTDTALDLIFKYNLKELGMGLAFVLFDAFKPLFHTIYLNSQYANKPSVGLSNL